MVIGDVVVRKSYDKDITFKIIDIKEVDGKTIYILKGISIRIIADSPEADLEPVDVDFIGEKEKILNSRINEAIKRLLILVLDYPLKIIPYYCLEEIKFPKIIPIKI